MQCPCLAEFLHGQSMHITTLLSVPEHYSTALQAAMVRGIAGCTRQFVWPVHYPAVMHHSNRWRLLVSLQYLAFTYVSCAEGYGWLLVSKLERVRVRAVALPLLFLGDVSAM
jgi:hypothetical protein